MSEEEASMEDIKNQKSCREAVIEKLEETPRPMYIGELHEEIGEFSYQRIQKVVDDLEEKDVVETEHAPQFDNRRYAQLTGEEENE